MAFRKRQTATPKYCQVCSILKLDETVEEFQGRPRGWVNRHVFMADETIDWWQENRTVAATKIAAQAQAGCKVCKVLDEVLTKAVPEEFREVHNFAKIKIGRSYEWEHSDGIFLGLTGTPRLRTKILNNTFDDLMVKAALITPLHKFFSAPIELYRAEGSESPFGAINHKPNLPKQLDDPLCFEKLRNWLSECMSEHTACRQSLPSWSAFAKNASYDTLTYLTGRLGLKSLPRGALATPLPTRVIDVGKSGSGQCRLHVSKKEAAPYVALSHCWGDASTVYTTTTDRLLQHQECIPEEQLSKTFLDAIRITREVGVRYLWIDSLCILQDSLEDWTTEAANMGGVFRNAHLTIAAVAGSDGGGGCLDDRQSRTTCRLDTAEELFGCEMFAAFDYQHIFPMVLIEEGGIFLSIINAYPLFTRKWCYQERILSRRILYYTKEELVWECINSVQCECGRLKRHSETLGEAKEHETSYSREPSIKERFNDVFIGASKESALTHYLSLVREYSFRNLTYPADVLPAFSAIARTFATADLGEYCAGLWSSHLLYMLCWQTVNSFARTKLALQLSVLEEELAKYHRIPKDCAPSWSWACVRSYISFPDAITNTSIDEDAQVVSVSCPRVDHNEFGRVRDATLKIDALAVMEKVVSYDKTRGRLNFPDASKFSFTKSWKRWIECNLDTEQDGEDIVGKKVWFVYIQNNRCLVLRDNDDQTFTRIGLLEPRSSSLLSDPDPSVPRSIASRGQRRSFVIV